MEGRKALGFTIAGMGMAVCMILMNMVNCLKKNSKL